MIRFVGGPLNATQDRTAAPGEALWAEWDPAKERYFICNGNPSRDGDLVEICDWCVKPITGPHTTPGLHNECADPYESQQVAIEEQARASERQFLEPTQVPGEFS